MGRKLERFMAWSKVNILAQRIIGKGYIPEITQIVDGWRITANERDGTPLSKITGKNKDDLTRAIFFKEA